VENINFFAKVVSNNETTHETNTVSVLTEKKERVTLRINKEEKLQLNAVYYFETEPIVFNEKDQLLINAFESIDTKELELETRQALMTCFYEYAPLPISEIKEIVESYLNKIENKVIKDIIMFLYEARKKEFYLYPAATKLHHAYISGLSHHTSTMLKLIDGFKEIYPFLDEDLLIAGVFLHDICKVKELSNYAGPEYTKEGKLLGHITMGVKAVELTAAKLGHQGTEEVLLLEHMVLAHHYYGNYGSPKKPNIPEALILHFIDNIDSKMTALSDALDNTSPGEFTQPITVLDRERYYKSKIKS
jgi:3'-5' exoribonuclease